MKLFFLNQRKPDWKTWTLILLSAGLHSTDIWYISYGAEYFSSNSQITKTWLRLAGKTTFGLLRWTAKCLRTGSVCEVQRLHVIWMSGDSWASCPVLPWDCRNAKRSGLRISFPSSSTSSSFLLPLFLLPPGDTASWRGRRKKKKGRVVCVCLWEGAADSYRAERVSHPPTAPEFRLQLCNRLGSEESKVQVNFSSLAYLCRHSRCFLTSVRKRKREKLGQQSQRGGELLKVSS